MTACAPSSASSEPSASPAALAGKTIAFLGTGSMAGAILTGLLDAGVDPGSVTATTRGAEHAAALRAAHPGLTVLSVAEDAAANRRAAASDLVVVGVKPYQVRDLLDDVAASLRPGSIVVSIAAGLTLADVAEHVPGGVGLVRAMPNTPAQVGAGVTGLAVAPGTPDAALRPVEALFSASGTVVVAPEERIDAISAVSGSGPAYFAYFVEQLTVAAERIGLPGEQARHLVEDTFVGSAELLRATGSSPAQMRRAVTSPGGTTEQALAVLADAGFADTLTAALQAAIDQAARLR